MIQLERTIQIGILHQIKLLYRLSYILYIKVS